MKAFKEDFITHLYNTLNLKKDSLISEKESIDIEIGKETKSSAGDKFETSREMMSQEREQIEKRIFSLQQQFRLLNDMKSSQKKNTVEFGSLVKTNKGYFLFGIAMGKIHFSNEHIFVLSLHSPIGKAFANKKVEDSIEFMNTTYTIQMIY